MAPKNIQSDQGLEDVPKFVGKVNHRENWEWPDGATHYKLGTDFGDEYLYCYSVPKGRNVSSDFYPIEGRR